MIILGAIWAIIKIRLTIHCITHKGMTSQKANLVSSIVDSEK